MSWPVNTGEAVLLLAGLAIVLVADLLLMRRALTPLGRLWEAMRRVEPLHPSQRVDPGARSVEVAELAAAVAEGHSSKTIGTLLHISDKTVERRRANVSDKLGLTDRVALTRYVIRRGLIEP